MISVGSPILRYFRIVNQSGAVTGLTLASFTVLFLRNNQSSPDILSVTDLTGGLYSAGYTPSSAGTDYVDLFEPNTSIRSVFTLEIVAAAVNGLAILNQATTLLPSGVAFPQAFVLSVFLTSDWINGNRSPMAAQGSTALNPDGTWATTLFVLPGTYTLVLQNSSTITVLTSNLKV